MTGAAAADDSDDLEATRELVRRAQGGDRRAFDDVLRRYEARVRSIVSRRLGPGLRRHLDSIDLSQDALCDAVRDFDRFEMRDESSLLRWLSAIVENRIRAEVDRLRAEKRPLERTVPLQPAVDSAVSEGWDHDPADSAPAALERLLAREALEELEERLSELRPDHREVLRRRYFESGDWATIAEQMELPSPDAARMLGTRAILELERRMR